MRFAFSTGLSGLALILVSAFATAANADDTLTCPPAPPTPQDLETWRLTAATALDAGTLTDDQIAAKVKECFPTTVPQCLTRLSDFSVRNVVAGALQDPPVAETPQKRPPDEFLNPGTTGLEYLFPENIEQLAAERGWPAVRYKSRHAGGFDRETPSLLMVYVAGDKVNPPVGYDRWLNFALPADTGTDALKPLPQARVPTAQDYADETRTGSQMPRTFTIVSLDRKVGLEPAKVYFQKFHRNGIGNPVFRPEQTSNLYTCVGCHPNGLRAISPLGYHVRDGEEQLPEIDWKTVELINQAMITSAGNKTVDWRNVPAATGEAKPLIAIKNRGPAIGPFKPLNPLTRTQEFIMGGTLADGTTAPGCHKLRTTINVTDIFNRAPGAGNVYRLSAEPNIDWQKVRDSMRCALCHNESIRGSLNDLTDQSQIDFKILVDQSMPLGAHSNPLDQGSSSTPVIDTLTPDERIAIANCLLAEYQVEAKELKAWLTQGACQ